MGILNNYGQTFISEIELRYFCSGERRIIQPKMDQAGKVVGIIDIILDEFDLENMIMYMKSNNLPFSLQVFNKIQTEYINYKSSLAESTGKIVQNNPFSKKLTQARM